MKLSERISTNRWMRILLGAIITVFFTCQAWCVLEVTNVRSSQRADGSGLVDVYYDLAGDTPALNVSVTFSADLGKNWDINPTTSTLSGDIGANIACGTNRHIVWNAGYDRPNTTWPRLQANVAVEMQNQTLILPSGVPLEMVHIPAGSFMMGSVDTGWSAPSEAPPHTVTIGRPFYIGKYEVTQLQWQSVMGSNPSFNKSDPNNPVETVSSNDCQIFINKLNSMGPGTFRLPSEAEWEYACRGGTTTRWSFGDDVNQLGDYAWYNANSGGRTQKVGTKKPNAYGLYDMLGNVVEHIQDYTHANYTGAPTDGSAWMTPVDIWWVFRGGDFSNGTNNTRCSFRAACQASNAYQNMGLRLVWMPTPPTTVYLPGNVPLEMVKIPAGSFTMGSTNQPNEMPPHPVVIPQPFYLGKFEVTQAQWQAVMGTNPSYFKASTSNPVEQVSWDDVHAFITKLNLLGLGTFRMPSEAEWEYACRAGTATNWSFGNDESLLANYAWVNTNCTETHPVGSKLPNQFGPYDMYGNVWEWCEDDMHDTYTGAPSDGSARIDSPRGSNRLMRGGAWHDAPVTSLSSYRNYRVPSFNSYSVGLRLVWTPLQKKIVYLPGNIPLELIQVTSGTFTMGSVDPGWSASNEAPVHQVRIGYDYCLGKYELTQAQYRAIMAGDNPSSMIGDTLPVHMVSWNQMTGSGGFLERLNQYLISTGQGGGFRLPSEAEWEYACRAGTTTRFHYGDDSSISTLNNYSWNFNNSGNVIHQVGTKLPNPWGFYDMLGNVVEWCQDRRHDDYNGAPTDGSAWETYTIDGRVLRGAEYWHNGNITQFISAWRGFNGPDLINNWGYRLVGCPSSPTISNSFSFDSTQLWKQSGKIHSTSHPEVTKWYNGDRFTASWSAGDFPQATSGWLWLIDDQSGTTVTLANGIKVSNATQSLDTTIQTDGMHAFHLVPVDGSGSPIRGSQENYFFYANLRTPTITSPTHPNVDRFYSNTTAVVNWTWSNRYGPLVSNFRYVYKLDRVAQPSFASGTVTGVDQTSLTLRNLEFGTYYLHLTSIDCLGTTSTYSVTYPLHVGPSGISLGSRFASDFTTDHNVDVQTSITEPNNTYNATLNAWYYKAWPADRKPIVQNISAQSGVPKTLTWDISTVTDGTYYIAVTYLDSNGTTQTAQSPGKVTVFKGPLTISSTTHPYSTRCYESPNATINWHRPDDCAPGAIKGFRYLVDANPDTAPGASANFASTSTLTQNFTIAPYNYGTNYFHIRWVDRSGKLSDRTSHYQFNIMGEYLNDYSALPWFDPFNSFDYTLWYRSSEDDSYIASSRMNLRNRATLESIGQQFNHQDIKGPYQIDLNGVTLSDANTILIVATRSDNNLRYLDLTSLTDAEKPLKSRMINNGIEVYLTQNKAEIYLRRMVSGVASDQLLGSKTQTGLLSGTHDVTVLDNWPRIQIFIDNNPNPIIDAVSSTYPGGGFLFCGGYYNGATSVASFDAVHVFRPEAPRLTGIGIQGETDLQHIRQLQPTFIWNFPSDDSQSLYEVQVQEADRTWMQLPLWDSQVQSGQATWIKYGAAGGSPSTAPALQEGVRYKFRVRAKSRTMWSQTWIGSDYTEYPFAINTAPGIASISIAPATPTDNDDLVCTATVSDALGDHVTLSYKWYSNGVLVPAQSGRIVPAAATSPGQVWMVEVTPFDGLVYGEARTAQVAISGLAATGVPAVTEISIDGKSVGNPAQLDALWHLTNSKPPIGWTYGDSGGATQAGWQVQVWTRPGGSGTALWDSGSVFGSASQATCGTVMQRGVTYYARVRVSNGTHWSDWAEQACRMNAVPAAPVVKIEPDGTAGPSDELRGIAMSTDADGDPVSYEYVWLRNGATTNYTAHKLPAGVMAAGEIWKLRARAWDGTEASAWAESAAVTVDAGIAHRASIQYDANGNMIKNKERTFGWDIENRLRWIKDGATTTSLFWYDGGEQRVKKVEGGRTTLYYGEHYELSGPTGSTPGQATKYYFAGSKRIAEVDPQGVVSYYHADHLGGTNVVTNASGAQVALSEYFPFGSDKAQTGSKNVNKKYTGKEKDSSGIYYYGARYYDSASNAFTSPDSIVKNANNPQMINHYAYALNNPSNNVDPSGHISLSSVYSQIVRIINAISSIIQSMSSSSSSSSAPSLSSSKGLSSGSLVAAQKSSVSSSMPVSHSSSNNISDFSGSNKGGSISEMAKLSLTTGLANPAIASAYQSVAPTAKPSFTKEKPTRGISAFGFGAEFKGDEYTAGLGPVSVTVAPGEIRKISYGIPVVDNSKFCLYVCVGASFDTNLNHNSNGTWSLSGSAHFDTIGGPPGIFSSGYTAELPLAEFGK